jgi:hypothetical protein
VRSESWLSDDRLAELVRIAQIPAANEAEFSYHLQMSVWTTYRNADQNRLWKLQAPDRERVLALCKEAVTLVGLVNEKLNALGEDGLAILDVICSKEMAQHRTRYEGDELLEKAFDIAASGSYSRETAWSGLKAISNSATRIRWRQQPLRRGPKPTKKPGPSLSRDPFRIWAVALFDEVHRAGGELTVSPSEAGCTSLKFIRRIEPCLPQNFVPGGLSFCVLRDIRKNWTEFRKFES